MAILERGTNYYYKIDVENCVVKHNQIYVALVIYSTAQDRQYEKETDGAFKAFLRNCAEKLQAYDDGMTEITEEREYERNGLEKAVYDISKARHNKIDMYIEPNILKLLMACEYNPEWSAKPIIIVGSVRVSVGIADGDALTTEQLYNRLKTNMNANIENV